MFKVIRSALNCRWHPAMELRKAENRAVVEPASAGPL